MRAITLRNSILKLFPFIISLLFICCPTIVEAQNRVQKGVARKITKSANEVITPVPGVQVTVGSVTSQKSDRNGKFSIVIAQSADGGYLLSNVRMPQETDYELVLPKISKKLYLSPNDLEIIVISKKEKEEDFKEKYRNLRKKYNDTSKELIALREELEDKKLDYDAKSKEYAALNQQLDSVQNLIDQYFNDSNRDQVTQLLKSVAQEMALTDYQSLDSLQRRIYDLKCQGDWQTISELILKSMKGDCATFLKEGKEMADITSVVARTAQEEFERRCRLAEQQIEAYKMLHLNDSVSYYYDLLIEVDPTNWQYLSEASTFEDRFRGNMKKALELNQKAYEIADTDILRAISLNNTGVIYSTNNYYKDALDYATKALELYKTIFGPGDSNLIAVYELLAAIYSGLDELDKANEMLDNAFEILSYYDDFSEMTTLLNNKGSVLSQMDRKEEALKTYEQALSQTDDNTDDENLLTKSIVLGNIGVMYSRLSRYSEAYDALVESLNIQIPILGELHPYVAQNLTNLGTLFLTLSQYGPAKEYTQNALDIYREIYGEHSSVVAIAYNNLGNIVVKENPQEGIELMRKALEINESLYGHTHSSVANVLNNLSTTYIEMGNIEEGSKMLMESIDIYKELFGEYNSQTMVGYLNYASTLSNIKEYDKALEYFQKALEISKEVYSDNSVYTAHCLHNMGVMYDKIGQYEQAIDYILKALAIRKNIYGLDNPEVASSYKNLATIYLKNGYNKQALENFEKSLSIIKARYGEDSGDYRNYQLEYSDFLGSTNNFEKAQEVAADVYSFYLEKLGETHPMTLTSMAMMYDFKYEQAKATNKEKEFYSTYIPVAYIAQGGESSNRGLSGKYIIVGLDQWNLTKEESYYDALANHANPYIILFYHDGEIIAETFEGKAGINTSWAPIDPEQRESIMKTYQDWLQAR